MLLRQMVRTACLILLEVARPVSGPAAGAATTANSDSGSLVSRLASCDSVPSITTEGLARHII